MRLAAVLLLAGCDWSLHRMQEQPRCKADGTLGAEPCDAQPPDGIVATDEPEPPPALTRALIVRGRDRFERFCAVCHGIAGDGDSYVAHAMTVRRPPSIVDAAASSLADVRILAVIASGYGVMPGQGAVLGPRDRHAVLAYVRVLQQREVAWTVLSPVEQHQASRAFEQEAWRWLP